MTALILMFIFLSLVKVNQKYIQKLKTPANFKHPDTAISSSSSSFTKHIAQSAFSNEPLYL
jgi:hypothetical protein